MISKEILFDGKHLVCEDLLSLRLFAYKMNMPYTWYHGMRSGFPHYDVPKYIKAIVMAEANYVRARKCLVVSKRCWLLNKKV
jgi:hypothetical protein